jgi:hypothetical protein
MRKLTCVVAALFLGLPMVLDAQQPGSSKSAKDPAKEQADALQDLLLDLKEAKGLAAGIKDTKLRNRMEKLLDQMEQNAKRLKAPKAKTAISKDDLAKLVTAIKSNAFDDGKYNVLKASVGQSYFTSDQAKSLVALFTFGDGQKKAAILLHPRLTDPQNFATTVLTAITFQNDRQEVLKALEKK